MSLAAFVSLEDISTELPPYTEEVIGVPMDAPLQAAYTALEEDIKNAIKQHHMNHSVVSVGLNALLPPGLVPPEVFLVFVTIISRALAHFSRTCRHPGPNPHTISYDAARGRGTCGENVRMHAFWFGHAGRVRLVSTSGSPSQAERPGWHLDCTYPRMRYIHGTAIHGSQG
jgi:hypothetical protein